MGVRVKYIGGGGGGSSPVIAGTNQIPMTVAAEAIHGGVVPYYVLTAKADGGWAPSNTAALFRDWLYVMPFSVPRNTTIERLAVRVTTAGAAGSVLRYGLYDSIVGRYYPNVALFRSAEFTSVANNETRETSGLAIALTAGAVYWACFLAGVADPTLKAQSATANPYFGFTDLSETGIWTGARVAYAYAALPDPFPAGLARLNADRVFSLFAKASAVG